MPAPRVAEEGEARADRDQHLRRDDDRRDAAWRAAAAARSSPRSARAGRRHRASRPTARRADAARVQLVGGQLQAQRRGGVAGGRAERPRAAPACRASAARTARAGRRRGASSTAEPAPARARGPTWSGPKTAISATPRDDRGDAAPARVRAGARRRTKRASSGSASSPTARVGWTTVSGRERQRADLQRRAAAGQQRRRPASAGCAAGAAAATAAGRARRLRAGLERLQRRRRSRSRHAAPSADGDAAEHRSAPPARIATCAPRPLALAACRGLVRARASRPTSAHCAPRWGSRGRCRRAPRTSALTFDDGPAPAGHAGGARACSPPAARGPPSSWSASRSQRHRALAAEIAAAGHGIALHGYRHRNLHARRRPRALRRRPRPRARADRRGDRESRPRLPPAVRDLQRRPACAIARAPRLGADAVVAWGNDWRGGATPADDRPAGDRRACRPATCCCCTTPTTTARRDSWRRTAAALPIVLDALERRGLRSIAL